VSTIQTLTFIREVYASNGANYGVVRPVAAPGDGSIRRSILLGIIERTEDGCCLHVYCGGKPTSRLWTLDELEQTLDFMRTHFGGAPQGEPT
jgi:hypothetical protein